MGLPGMPSCFCATGLSWVLSHWSNWFAWQGLYSLPLSIKSRFNWLDKVAGDSLPSYQAGCHPNRWAPWGRCQGNRRSEEQGPDSCHWASAEPLGLSPSHMIAAEQWSLQALRHHPPLPPLPPPPTPATASPSQVAAASGSWWHFVVGFVFGLDLFLIKKIDPLMGGRGARTRCWQVSCCSLRGWGITSLFLCDPETHVHSLAIENTLTTHTLIMLVLRCTY